MRKLALKNAKQIAMQIGIVSKKAASGFGKCEGGSRLTINYALAEQMPIWCNAIKNAQRTVNDDQ
jgi:hypothetical protein